MTWRSNPQSRQGRALHRHRAGPATTAPHQTAIMMLQRSLQRPWGPGAMVHRPCRHHVAQPRAMQVVAAAAEGEFELEEDSDEYFYEDTALRLYLDSASAKEWEKWGQTGLFYGITTNPTILKRDGVQCTLPSLKKLAAEGFAIGAQEVQLQAWGATAAEMSSVGRDLFGIDDRIVVKLPITMEGVKAAKVLSDEGIPFTLTGIYASHQVVTALACGASYAAPYLGRMNDAGKDGLKEIIKMQNIVMMDEGEEGSMRLLVASLRDPAELADLAAEGCNTFTISPAVAKALFDEQLTNEAADVFLQHAQEMGAGKQ